MVIMMMIFNYVITRMTPITMTVAMVIVIMTTTMTMIPKDTANLLSSLSSSCLKLSQLDLPGKLQNN